MVVLALAAGLVSPAVSQPPGGRGGFRGGPGMMGGPGMLLQNSGVQKELKLSDEQIQKIKDISQKIQDKHKGDFEALAKVDQQERREKFQELFKSIGEETEKALAEVLKPEQAKRLKQISLQQRGSQAFNDDEVQKDLKLTDDQKDKIKTLNEDLGKDTREIFQNAQGNFREAGEKAATLRKETLEKVVSLLTDEQKKEWKEMTGEPFEVKFEAPRSGFGGRRPPPPPGKEKDKE
jgi:Spy/CpxP family protein refolding chaperone